MERQEAWEKLGWAFPKEKRNMKPVKACFYASICFVVGALCFAYTHNHIGLTLNGIALGVSWSMLFKEINKK